MERPGGARPGLAGELDDSALNAGIRDPHSVYARLRAQSPVYVGNVRDEFGVASDLPPDVQAFAAMSYDAVQKVFRDTATYSSHAVSRMLSLAFGRTILEMDDPEHEQLRSLLAEPFRAKSLERWLPEVIDPTLELLVDGLRRAHAAGGSADLVSLYALPLPIRVISRMLGLPPDDWTLLLRWTIQLIQVTVDLDTGLRASKECGDYFMAHIEQRRRHGGDDLTTLLIESEVDGERLTDVEIRDFLRLLLPAGAETTYRGLATMMYALLTHAEPLEAVRQDRALIPNAVEESLRWETPVQHASSRMTTVDTELCGVEIPAGAFVRPVCGSANRDEQRWDDPDVFDISRPLKPPHLSFAQGAHTCLGIHLAKLEMREALRVFLDEFPEAHIDPSATDVHIEGLTMRSPPVLPVVLG